ncbi:MAG TPA: hypothetical protein VMW08_02735 [Acidimicrobiales bacterium]|nr:hypothetical protein [Acidimicrobiales bacterium]
MTDWASPAEESDVPRPQPIDRAPRPAPVDERRARGPALAPRTPTELIDHAFGFLRRHPREVVTTSALFVVPFAVVVAYLQRNVLGGESFIDAFSGSDPSLFADGQTGSDSTLQVVSFIGPSIGLVYVAAALATMVAAERAGQVVDGSAAFVHALKATPALLISWVLVHVIEVVGLVLFVVPGVFAVIAFTVVAPVIGVERVGPLASMKRSNQLTSRRRGPVLGVILLSFFVELVVANALTLLPSFIAAVIGFDIGWIVLGVGSAVVSLITTPFVALVSVELYLDLRVRTEALDIEMRVPELFDTA